MYIYVCTTGEPTMKKAEVLKLKREAATLDTGNIISTEGEGVVGVHI